MKNLISKQPPWPTRLLASLCFTALLVAPSLSFAGLKEGLAAYGKADYVSAWKELSPLAEKGNAAAQLKLGKMYSLGQGVESEKTEAARWFHLAAKQGVAEAQTVLGYLCLTGEGVSQNSDLAIEWTRKAAAQGDATAQYNLSVMYGDDFGVKKNPAESLKWLRKSAEQRDGQALLALGSRYAQGKEGVKKNEVFAYTLFDASAKAGNKVAVAQLNDLEKSMSPQDIRMGKELAGKWRQGTRLTHVLRGDVNK